MEYFTLEEVLLVHFNIIEDFGGVHGVRDEGRLNSAVNASAQEIFGEEQYKTPFEKAAAYARNIIGGHPFVDGNKRTGVTLAVIFLNRQGWKFTAIPKELEDFAVKIAVEHLDIPDIATWLDKLTVR